MTDASSEAIIKEKTEGIMTLDEKLAAIVPHKRQVKFQQLEFYAFIHFTVNTFTDKK